MKNMLIRKMNEKGRNVKRTQDHMFKYKTHVLLCFILGPQMVMFFGKVLETFQSRFSVEELGYWKPNFKSHMTFPSLCTFFYDVKTFLCHIPLLP